MTIGFGAVPAFAQANPDAATTNAARGRCADPWVALALDNQYGRGNWGPALCPVKLYNNGQWGSFAELNRAVAENWRSRRAQAIKLMTHRSVPGSIVIVEGNTPVALLPASLVAAGGGNLIGNDGGSLIGTDGGTLVAAGGGNLSSLPTASFGPPQYSVQAVSGKAPPKKVAMGPNTLSWQPR
ncbi:MAG: hypothetical protein WDN24_02915 [Sphingomonas sp.]